MTAESMAISIGKCNEEIKDWEIDFLEQPNFPNEIGSDLAGFQYILGARALYANSLSVSFDMNSEINRKAGSIDKDRMYKQTGPLSCKIDVEFYISSNHFSGFYDPYLFMRDDIPCGNGTGENFFPITIGKNIYNKCFLDNLNITIRPFAPVTCRASFRATSPPSGVPLEGIYTAQKDERSNNYLMDSDNFVYGHNCQLSGWLDNLVDINCVSEINFSRSYGRKDVYCLGEQTPRESLVKDVENRMVVRSTGLKVLIPSEGIRVPENISVIWRDCSGNRPYTEPFSGAGQFPIDLSMNMNSGCYVTRESYTMRGGGTLETELTISEAIL